MGTTVSAVERHLQTDLPLLDMLARGLASLRRTARWLIEEYGWDASEEAVVSALRRYIDSHPTPPLTRDRSTLGATHVDLRTGLAVLVLPRRYGVHGRLGQVWDAIEDLDTVSILDGHKRTRLVVEQKNLRAVEALFPPASIEEVLAPVASVQLKLPEENDAVSVVGQVVGMMVHHGVRVLDVFSSLPECSVLVEEELTMEAYDVAARLTAQRAAANS